MKKIFQNIVDRIHVIYLVLTRKHFIFSCYNTINIGKITGGGFVEQLPDNPSNAKSFVDATSDMCNHLVDIKLKKK